jgi:hypothetical protein
LEGGEEEDEGGAELASPEWVTKLSPDEMRELHARVMDSSILLKMKPPKLRGLAKQLHANDPTMPKPRLLGEILYFVFLGGDEGAACAGDGLVHHTQNEAPEAAGTSQAATRQ